MPQLTLTIAIPTYNRAGKVARLLGILQEQIRNGDCTNRVSVLVSDNASADETAAVVAAAQREMLNLAYHCQPQNQGFDGNMLSLYKLVTSDYVWFLADDDIPLPGAISEILRALDENRPEGLLFSFEQPPGSPYRAFTADIPLYLVTDPRSIIEHLGRYTKVSIFVLRRIALQESDWTLLEQHAGDGWMFLVISFTVFGAAVKPTLAIIPKALACSDESFRELEWTPAIILRLHKPFLHPYVVAVCPELTHEKFEQGYCSAIDFLLGVQTGYLIPQRPGEYEEFGRSLPWRWAIFMRHPKALIKLLLAKTTVARRIAGPLLAFQRAKEARRAS